MADGWLRETTEHRTRAHVRTRVYELQLACSVSIGRRRRMGGGSCGGIYAFAESQLIYSWIMHPCIPFKYHTQGTQHVSGGRGCCSH